MVGMSDIRPITIVITFWAWFLTLSAMAGEDSPSKPSSTDMEWSYVDGVLLYQPKKKEDVEVAEAEKPLAKAMADKKKQPEVVWELLDGQLVKRGQAVHSEDHLNRGINLDVKIEDRPLVIQRRFKTDHYSTEEIIYEEFSDPKPETLIDSAQNFER